MKTEDYEKLKQLCNENGFELVTESPKENDKFFVVKKKDIWDGVEFVEYIHYHLSGGEKYFKVNWIDKEKRLIHFHSGYLHCELSKPSTESAYIEQLKRIAFEKFGEIKEGDKFKSLDDVNRWFSKMGNFEWDYIKEKDMLFYYNICLYQQGKWAEKLPERVKVQVLTWNYENGDYYSDKFSITFLSKNLRERNYEKIGEYIANQLETYLNDTNNNQD